jgi:hypothetical protein
MWQALDQDLGQFRAKLLKVPKCVGFWKTNDYRALVTGEDERHQAKRAPVDVCLQLRKRTESELLDYLVGEREKLRRDAQSQRMGGCGVDQLE